MFDLHLLCSDLSSELSRRLLGALQLLLHLLQHLPLHPHLLLQVLVSGLALAQGLLRLGRLHLYCLDDVLGRKAPRDEEYREAARKGSQIELVLAWGLLIFKIMVLRHAQGRGTGGTCRAPIGPHWAPSPAPFSQPG